MPFRSNSLTKAKNISITRAYMDNDFLGDAQILQLSEKIHQAVLDHFHLVEQPYQGGPDFRFLYTTDQVKEAILKSIILTTQRVNPVYMYGSYGIGKSTIIQRLYALLLQEPRFDAKFIILHSKVTANSLLRDILELFDIKTERSYHQSLKSFQQFLIGELPPEKSTKRVSKNESNKQEEVDNQTMPAEKIPLLLIDEAQYMDKEALRLLHSLLNYESSRVKRIQIIIAGQEKLAENILKLGELASRMKAIQMYNMTPEELQKMLFFRWEVAGGKDEDFPFAKEDLEIFRVLHDYTSGLPRDAIKVADDVLRFLLSHGKKKISASELEAIANENNLHKK